MSEPEQIMPPRIVRREMTVTGLDETPRIPQPGDPAPEGAWRSRRWLPTWLRRILCRHDWQLVKARDVYIRRDGCHEMEYLVPWCPKCGASRS